MSHKILIIDDEPDALNLLETRLKANDFQVMTALGPQEGLARLRETVPDLIILDVLMPKMTGYDFVREIKGMPENYRKIPVIVTSARKGMKEFFNAWEIHSFIAKPYDSEELMNRIRSALQIKSSDLPNSPETPASSSSPALRGKSGCVLILGIDDYLVGKLKDLFLKLNYQVETATDEEDAVQQAVTLRPKLMMGQYWEDPLTLDIKKVQKKIHSDPATQSVRFVAFSPAGLGVDAMKMLEKTEVLTYSKSEELMTKVTDYLKANPL